MRASVAAILLLVGTLPVPSAGQSPRGLTRSPVETMLERARDLHFRMRPAKAMEVYRSVIERYPEHRATLVGAAGEALTLGILASDDNDAARWYDESAQYARRALQVSPDDPEAHSWLGAALGRQALQQGPRSRVQLAGQIREHARATLAADSAHARGHHVLGLWHAEVERIGGVSRFFAEHLLGGEALEGASWDEALQHLERAVELAPQVLIYRIEWARALADRERVDEARSQLRRVLEDPVLHPVDPMVKQRAQELLKALR